MLCRVVEIIGTDIAPIIAAIDNITTSSVRENPDLSAIIAVLLIIRCSPLDPRILSTHLGDIRTILIDHI